MKAYDMRVRRRRRCGLNICIPLFIRVAIQELCLQMGGQLETIRADDESADIVQEITQAVKRYFGWISRALADCR